MPEIKKLKHVYRPYKICIIILLALQEVSISVLFRKIDHFMRIPGKIITFALKLWLRKIENGSEILPEYYNMVKVALIPVKSVLFAPDNTG